MTPRALVLLVALVPAAVLFLAPAARADDAALERAARAREALANLPAVCEVRDEPFRISAAPEPTLCGEGCVACASPCARGCVECRPWHTVDLTLPIWIPGVTGTFAKGSTKVHGDRGESDSVTNAPDILTKFEFAFMGRVDARWGRWTAYADAFGVALSSTADFRVNALDAKANLSAWIGRVIAGYRFVEARPGARLPIDVDLGIGARLMYVSTELEEPTLLAFKADDTWADPLVAARVTAQLSRKFQATVLADVGGFDAGSHRSWSVTAEVSWRVSSLISVSLGYSWLDVRRDVGSGAKEFELDILLRGPQLGITFHL